MNPRTPTGGDLESLLYIDYRLVRENFIAWLKTRGLNWHNHVRKLIEYLDKYAKPIRTPMDLVRMFADLTNSQKRHLKNGLRSLFKFYEVQGLIPSYYLDILRKNLPRTPIGIDLRVPSDREIIKSLETLKTKSRRDFVFFNLLLDSGLRITEGLEVIKRIVNQQFDCEAYDGFIVIPLGMLRRTKTAYYCFLTEDTLLMIEQLNEVLTWSKIRDVARRLNVTSWKYIRKYAFDKMIELEIPESVADFIEGRVPRTIGAMHYLGLRQKAIHFYPRYCNYLKKLRRNLYTHNLEMMNNEIISHNISI